MSSIPEVPRDMPWHHQEFLQSVKKIIERRFPPDTPPSPPSNLTPHPMPGGVQITFTGGEGAERHLLLVSDQAVWNPGKANNHIIDLGQSTLHVHLVGQGGVARHYWVVAVRGNSRSNPPTGPVQATTLGLNVAASGSKYVPLQQNMVKSFATKRATVMRPKKGGQRDLL